MSNYGSYLQAKSLKEVLSKQFLCRSGGTMCGAINMDCNKITNVDVITFCNGNVFDGSFVLTEEHLDFIASEISGNFVVLNSSGELIQDLDAGCNNFIDVSSISFCNGTYIGPGDSFDISTNNNLRFFSLANIFNSNTTFNENVNIIGDLIVSGTTTTIDTSNLIIKDNIILMNQPTDASGNPINEPLLDRNNFYSGFVIYRGPDDLDVLREPYVILYDNATETLRIGISGELLPVATREDNPLNNGIAIWSDTDKRFNTITLFDSSGNIDLSCNSILDVSSISFCDGTYIGPGRSFDISTNEIVNIINQNGLSLAVNNNGDFIFLDGSQPERVPTDLNNTGGNEKIQTHVLSSSGASAGFYCYDSSTSNSARLEFYKNESGDVNAKSDISSNSTIGFVGFRGMVNNSYSLVSRMLGGTSDSNSTNLEGVIDFQTKELNSSLSTKMRISGNGNVGIGTISPNTKLEVIGDTSLNALHVKNQKTFGDIGSVYDSFPIAKFTVNQTPDDLDRGLEIGAPSGGVTAPVYLKVTGTSNDFRILDNNNNNNLTIKSGGTAGGEPYFGFSETDPKRKYVFATERPPNQSATLMALYNKNKNYKNAGIVLSFRNDISGGNTFVETGAIGLNTFDFNSSNKIHGTDLNLYNFVNDSLNLMVELNHNNYLNVFSDICLNCNQINDVSGINFCDGTYIGPGGSFDISTNDEFKLIQNGTENLKVDMSGNLFLNETNRISFNDVASVNQGFMLPTIHQQPVLLERISVLTDSTGYTIASGATEKVRFTNPVVNQMNLSISGSNYEIISPSLDISGQLVEIYLNVNFTGGSNGDIQFDISSVAGNSFLEEIDNRNTKSSGTYFLTFGPHMFLPNEWSGTTAFNMLLRNNDNQTVTINSTKVVLKSRYY